MLTLLGIQTMEEDPAWRTRELDRLLTQVGEGDREALAEVYHRARASVYALALSLLKMLAVTAVGPVLRERLVRAGIDPER